MLDTLFLSHVSIILDEFARAGGGGSGGDGAAGILALIGAIGYFPMALIGKLLRRKKDSAGWPVLQLIGWGIAGSIALVLLVLTVLSNSLILGLYILLPIAVGVVLGMGAGLYEWFAKLKQSTKTAQALRMAEKKDQVWNEKKLQSYGEGIFLQFQKDWSDFNLQSMGRYMTLHYQQHVSLMLQAMREVNRVNKVMSPRIIKSLIVEAVDSEDDSKDTFTLGITAKADDQLIDTRTNSQLFRDQNQFTEFWVFRRNGTQWLLETIRQDTASAVQYRPDIQNFAAENNMYYSVDWGWLLLPQRGYLFQGGKFGISDINNHVIGYATKQGLLAQIYTYQEVAATTKYSPPQYVVMQTSLPKSYGQILVRRRSGLINWKPKGLTQVKMEWGEFNDLYDVYASDLEKVTSFELLNPAFMVHLRELPFEANLEVVDNVVYVFAQTQLGVVHYQALLNILQKAYKEMKL